MLTEVSPNRNQLPNHLPRLTLPPKNGLWMCLQNMYLHPMPLTPMHRYMLICNHNAVALRRTVPVKIIALLITYCRYRLPALYRTCYMALLCNASPIAVYMVTNTVLPA